MNFELKRVNADLCIVGAGAAGICCALQAARQGVSTVLINDRGFVGGNSSAEIRVGMEGAADGNSVNINLREGGIIDEIKQEHRFRSPCGNHHALDGVFMDLIYKEKNLQLFLNTCVDELEQDEDGRILLVRGTQNSTETRWEFSARWFVDDTGDGTIGALSGAEFMLGREAAKTFGERIAPEEADSFCIPSTLRFSAKDMGFPVRFVAPDFADDIPASGALRYREIPHSTFDRMMWYYEVSGELDQVREREEIMRQHRSLVAGIWDYIKNSGEYPEAASYDLDYVAGIPGMREYRRLVGDVILTEGDLVHQKEYDDAVGHGGWNIDLHAIKGFYDTDLVNRHIHFRGPYQIPYRCGYSKNIENLFMCGRCMSTSHVAFGSTRVSATLATLGQAVGMAAAICKENNTTPRGVYENHRKELQQRLLREDQLIPGARNEDPNDKARQARVSASSAMALESKQGREYEYTPLEEGLGLVIPVAERLDSLTMEFIAQRDCVLPLRIFQPSKPYNYGPDELVGEREVRLAAGKSVVSLPMGISQGGQYYFVELGKSEGVSVLTVKNELPTTIMFQKHCNNADTVWDYYAMKPVTHAWRRTRRIPSFTPAPAQPVYEASGVNNGYNRAYGQPNLWHAGPEDGQPTLRLAWDEPVELSMVQLTFYIDTTFVREDNHNPYFAGVAADYRIYACHKEKRTLLAQIKDNHMKCRRHTFDTVACDALEIVFDRGAVERRIGVQEIRAE